MKRTICVLCMILTLFCVCACGDAPENRTKKNTTKTVSDVLNGDTKSSQSESSKKPEVYAAEDDVQSEKCDVDLAAMNATMVYAEVSNIMTTPKNYMGKIIKMKGDFSVYETPARNYYACIIADATACCSQGIEFVLKDARKYPDEYPAQGTEITVIGEFETYLEDGKTYCQLKDARMYK